VDVLKHVPFKQLFGNCALINSEFRVLIYNPPIPFPVAADFAIKANDRFSTISAAKVLNFLSKVDGKRVVKLNLSNLSKMPKNDYTVVLAACPNLKVLKLKRCFELSDEDAQRIPEFCPLIEVLSIELVHIEQMNFIFELKHLRELNLKGCIQLSTETIPFEELTKRETKIPLKRLQIPKYLDNEIIKYLGAVFPQLDTLLLPGYNYLTEESVQNMPKSLTELNLMDIVAIQTNHIISISQQCSKLKRVDFLGSKISDEAVKHLLENCKELESWHWTLQGNTNSGLKMLGNLNRSLKRLVLHYPPVGITDEGFRTLHNSQNQLEELYLLAFRHAPNVSCAYLIEANALTLRKLILKAVPYEPQMLVEISKCKNLTHLVLDVNEGDLELWRTLFASLSNLEWLYIKDTLVLENFEALLGGCSKLRKLIVEDPGWKLPPSASNITIVFAPMGWNFEDFIKEPKAITKQDFDLV
jgi:hypothetical protein